jgi:uncharacterized protein (TIGR03032 family)
MARLAAPVLLVGAAEPTATLLAALAAGAGVFRAREPVAGILDADDPAAALSAALTDREGRAVSAAPGDARPVLADPALAARAAELLRAFPDARVVALDVPAPAGVPPERVELVSHAALVADPRAQLTALCVRLGLPYDQAMLSPYEDARRAQGADAPEALLGSASTPGFRERLLASGGSLLVSTYQTNTLIVVRAREGELNTHFRGADKPMGLAVRGDRLAIGMRTEVWDLRDTPAVAPRLDPPGTHDACFLPRNRHVTGDIAVHELAWADDGLWLVATSFSCLATLDADHSFVPRWTPPFVSALAAGDRCHLNGLAVVDGRPRYVTALGATDEPGGWRAGKATGGVLVDVASGETVAAGLSMPHSPRVHDGRLYVLASGRGELCVVDEASGRAEPVAELPGFTRGLTFAGRTAFVGLSQIRESSTFGDLPLTQRLRERQAGVWAVDLDTGAVAGFLRFDDLVQEVFDVAFLPGRRWPEVAEPGSSAVAQSYVLP